MNFFAAIKQRFDNCQIIDKIENNIHLINHDINYYLSLDNGDPGSEKSPIFGSQVLVEPSEKVILTESILFSEVNPARGDILLCPHEKYNGNNYVFKLVEKNKSGFQVKDDNLSEYIYIKMDDDLDTVVDQITNFRKKYHIRKLVRELANDFNLKIDRISKVEYSK